MARTLSYPHKSFRDVAAAIVPRAAYTAALGPTGLFQIKQLHAALKTLSGIPHSRLHHRMFSDPSATRTSRAYEHHAHARDEREDGFGLGPFRNSQRHAGHRFLQSVIAIAPRFLDAANAGRAYVDSHIQHVPS